MQEKYMLNVSQQIVLPPYILKQSHSYWKYLSNIMSHVLFKNLFKFICKRLLYLEKFSNMKSADIVESEHVL
jgi:hypothetical protein